MAKLALLIGVSEYQPGLNPLPAAVRDIEAMQRVLLNAEMGGFDEANLLENPDKAQIEIEIETLFSRCTKDDLVLLFFSGHGIKDDQGRLYFAATNTSKSLKGDLIRSSAVLARFVHERMVESRCKRQAVILDCCFSGAFDPALMAKDDGSVDLQTQLGSSGRVVLTSSSSTQYSFQHEDTDLSIYTRYLVEGIETGAGDADEDGNVSADELHQYAASKVQETAPGMTPKIIVLKDEGYNLVLAKARIADPQLVYRREASRFAAEGRIRPVGRIFLNQKRKKLGLTELETSEIEAELLRPFQERLENLGQYRAALTAECEHDYPLSEQVKTEMQNLQNELGLRDEDILPIQNELEKHFTEQRETYQQHLEQYKTSLVEAINQQFPFSQETSQALFMLQESLGLKTKDINQIRQPLIEQAEVKHQQKLKQEAQQRQQKEKQAKYKSNLRRYEKEFTKAVNLTYPLDTYVRDGLKQFQQSLELVDADVARIEQPILEKAEAKRQEQIRQQLKQEAQQRQQKEKQAKYKSNLRRFEYETVTVNDRGEITHRQSCKAECQSIDLGNGISLEVVKIPEGTFTMGSPSNELERRDDEGPQHKVTVPSFYLGKYQVTQAQWEALMESNPFEFKGANRPVEQVTWNGSVEFCQKLSQKSGKEFRLPSDAEWEYACRAGTATPFHFGETITPEIANYNGTYTYGSGPKGDIRGQTTEVGSFPPNAFGLYDMHGNVYEWCQDHWHDNYEGVPTNGSAWISENDNNYRIIRGGSWADYPEFCRSASRVGFKPSLRYLIIGFRVACSALNNLELSAW